MVNVGLDCQYFNRIDDISGSASRIRGECIELIHYLLLHAVVVCHNLLACLHDLVKDSLVGLTGCVSLFLNRLKQHQERDCKVLGRCITQRVEGAKEAEEGLDLLGGNLPVLVEQEKRHGT